MTATLNDVRRIPLREQARSHKKKTQFRLLNWVILLAINADFAI